jgi:DNA-binding MarR family transcriptional regulator
MSTTRQDQINAIESLFQQLTWRGRLRFSHRVEKYGLTMPQYLALAKIQKLGPDATMSEVSDALLLPRSSMTSIADRLVGLGLVVRGSLESDRRAVSATITQAGTELIRTVDAERNAELTAMLADLTTADLGEFARLLGELLEALQQFPPDDG